jgi:hypothetical protein
VLWTIRASLILQFFSFWLVTPAIIGERGLEKARTRLNDVATKIKARAKATVKSPFLIVPVAALALLAFWAFNAVGYAFGYSWMQSHEKAQLPRIIQVFDTWSLRIGVPILAVCVALISAVYVLYGLVRILNALINYGTKSAHALLVVGALLFSAGIVLSFVATWLP